MLKPSLEEKLRKLEERRAELHALLADAGVIRDTRRFRQLSMEAAEVEPVVSCFQRYRRSLDAVRSASEMLDDPDAEIRAMARGELQSAQQAAAELESRLQVLLLPVDPADRSNVYLEIRAGTGGQEAALFAAALLRMYGRYAERRGWKMEVLSATPSDLGGYKEVITRVSGDQVYARLKFESGVHRVQRVPETEAQGRIHTSAGTVAVLPELEEIEEVEINPAELRIDTYRASGAGGQHVNKTDSAIRITHLPSGMVVECQDERSQHKNRARAMALLKTRLLNAERERQESERAANRRSLVGSGDRSERIRTYNFPQGRVTDHRINLTLYRLDDVMDGSLDALVDPLVQEYQADQLAALAGT